MTMICLRRSRVLVSSKAAYQIASAIGVEPLAAIANRDTFSLIRSPCRNADLTGSLRYPQGHGFSAAINMNSAGKVVEFRAREMVTTPSSSGCRITSSVRRLNSGNSSRKSTPLWLSEISPGVGVLPPPTTVAINAPATPGAMASKLAAARIASWSGVRTVIARASRPDVLVDAVGDRHVGTTFAAHDRRLPARKLWIAFAAEVAGSITVDEGARQALTTRSTSLLPAGVRAVAGSFAEGDTVDVIGPDGMVFARGMAFVAAADLRAVAGRQTRDLPQGMVHEVIHRDDLVMLPT